MASPTDSSNWMQRTDVGIKFQQNHKPKYSIETVQPVTHFDENSKSVVFVQGRLESQGGEKAIVHHYWDHDTPGTYTHASRVNESHDDIGTIGSVGIGYRRLSRGEHSYVGINAFYDRAFKEKYNRRSIGVEYVVNENKLYAHIYKGNSAIKKTFYKYTGNLNHPYPDGHVSPAVLTEYAAERGVDGYTIGYERTFSHARWLNPYVEYYHWSLDGWRHWAYWTYPDIGVNQNHTVAGLKLGANIQLTPHISMDVGLDKPHHHSGESYVQVMYTLGKKPFALWGGKHSDESMTIARFNMLDKVRRHTMIINRYEEEEWARAAGNQL